MPTRETHISKSVEYDSATCTNCGDNVFIDNEMENIDNLPEGVPIVITGGENMTVDTTSFTASSKSYRIPKTVIKIFGMERPTSIEDSYLCPACAASVYDLNIDR
jgi:ribosomal protein S27AE